MLKCTLYCKRVQKNSIILEILKDFYVNSIFYQTKIPNMNRNVLIYSKFSKQIGKIIILQLHEEWKISPSQVQKQGSKNGTVVHPFTIAKVPFNQDKTMI